MNDERPWYRFGLCAGAASEKFFPERGESTKEAKALCLACPVRTPCLEYAVMKPEKHGIWGGMTERERRRVRRRMHASQLRKTA